MRKIAMEINSWRPRDLRPTVDPDSGIAQSEFYLDSVVVGVFAFPGDDKFGAFTNLRAYHGGQRHEARLGRCYHPRWHARLARRFEEEIGKLQRKREDGNGNSRTGK